MTKWTERDTKTNAEYVSRTRIDRIKQQQPTKHVENFSTGKSLTRLTLSNGNSIDANGVVVVAVSVAVVHRCTTPFSNQQCERGTKRCREREEKLDANFKINLISIKVRRQKEKRDASLINYTLWMCVYDSILFSTVPNNQTFILIQF